MSDKPRAKIERLELNRETVRELTEQEAENARGGAGGGAWRPAGGARVYSVGATGVCSGTPACNLYKS